MGESKQLTSEPITAKDIQDLSDAISAGSSTPDTLIMDKASFDAYKNIFNNWMDFPKFEAGEWVFDGIEMFEVLRQNGDRLEVARMTDQFHRGGVLAIRKAQQVQKIPKGSKLETVKTLFGKK